MVATARSTATRLIIVFCLFAFCSTFISGCSSDTAANGLGSGQVFYYDRNGDGKVDLERHHYPGVADADWELRDDNYDGRYEKKILYGYAVMESSVDIPVPTNVPISSNPSR